MKSAWYVGRIFGSCMSKILRNSMGRLENSPNSTIETNTINSYLNEPLMFMVEQPISCLNDTKSQKHT